MSYVKVLIRTRPLLEYEREKGLKSTLLNVIDTQNLSVQFSHATNKVFKFDRVFGQQSTQPEVFEQVEPLVAHVLDGLHATVFAYGQTGSGKTHTMEGYEYAMTDRGKVKPVMNTDSSKWGITIRTINSLFALKEERHRQRGLQYRIQCSYMQIYNEKVYDLLNPNQKVGEGRKGDGLRIRWSKNDHFFVENLFVFECDNPDQVMELFQAGVKNKSMGSHQMNLASSRSHCIFTLYVDSWEPSAPDLITKSEFSLVDLAGSEKLSLLAQNPSQKLLQESIDINTSLLSLGKVIQALSSETPTHVPYRESKLTKLLKHALGGNSLTVMVACINPADSYIEESLCTLYYAGRANNIKNDPRVNEDPKTSLIKSLKQEIESLKLELSHYRKLLLDDKGLDPDQLAINIKPSGITNLKDVAPGSENAYLAERLVNSVKIMKDLVTVNGQLRENFDKLLASKTSLETGYSELSKENVDLRERIEILESIVVQQPYLADGEKQSAPPLRAKDEVNLPIIGKPSYSNVQSVPASTARTMSTSRAKTPPLMQNKERPPPNPPSAPSGVTSSQTDRSIPTDSERPRYSRNDISQPPTVPAPQQPVTQFQMAPAAAINNNYLHQQQVQYQQQQQQQQQQQHQQQQHYPQQQAQHGGQYSAQSAAAMWLEHKRQQMLMQQQQQSQQFQMWMHQNQMPIQTNQVAQQQSRAQPSPVPQQPAPQPGKANPSLLQQQQLIQQQYSQFQQQMQQLWKS